MQTAAVECSQCLSGKVWMVVFCTVYNCSQAKLDKSWPPKAEDVVRLYDSLMGSIKELSDTAAHLGGAAGEVLLEECIAKVCHLIPDSWSPVRMSTSSSLAMNPDSTAAL